MEIIKLIGVLIVVIGFILKLDTLAVVVVAGLAAVLHGGQRAAGTNYRPGPGRAGAFIHPAGAGRAALAAGAVASGGG